MENAKKTYIPILKGVLMSLIITMVAILLFAGIIKLTEMQSGAIHFVNQIIKAFSILCGCFYGIKNGKSFLKGIVIGLVTMLAAHIIFSILEKQSIFSMSILYEMLFGAVCGGICGMITGMIKKSN